MKVLMAILLMVLMIGAAPAFAASDLADENSGYIDGYDDDGNYIGNYTVVDSSDLEDASSEYNNYVNESDQPDDTDNHNFSSSEVSDMPGEGSDHTGELDSSPVVNSTSIDAADDYIIIDSQDVLDILDEDNNYLFDESEVLNQPDEDNIGELNAADQLEGNEFCMITESEIEFEYNELSDLYSLNESIDDDTNELDTEADPLDDQSFEIEAISQIDTNCKPLIVTIVNGLCGVVQATLEGLCNVCMVLGNEFKITF